MARNVIVVGPPRSGTSLTAAVFARQGYYVGSIGSQALRDGDDNNPYGYFEADALIEHNAAILARSGFPFHNTWKYERMTEQQIQRLESMLPSAAECEFVSQHAERQPWMWKDPRLCFTLPVWAKACPPQCVVVVVRRATEQVVNSFVRMGWCEDTAVGKRAAAEVIELHATTAERFAREAGMPFAGVDYSDYLNQPATVAARLSELCDLHLCADALNFRRDLSHSSFRGRLSAKLRRSLDSGVLRNLKVLKPVVPKTLLTTLFPEKRYQQNGSKL